MRLVFPHRQGRSFQAESISLAPWVLGVSMVIGNLIWYAAANTAPPEPSYDNEVVRQYHAAKPIERWRLQKNPVHGEIIRAQRIPESAKPVPDIPSCGFTRPIFWASGNETVVDRSHFTDLRVVRGRQARQLGAEGITIGRILDKQYEPRQLVKLLVTSGVVDANMHVVATVSLLEEGRNSRGYWCRLVSDDSFWTNRENRVVYDFGILISTDGEIRLMHVDRVGASDNKSDKGR